MTEAYLKTAIQKSKAEVSARVRTQRSLALIHDFLTRIKKLHPEAKIYFPKSFYNEITEDMLPDLFKAVCKLDTVLPEHYVVDYVDHVPLTYLFANRLSSLFDFSNLLNPDSEYYLQITFTRIMAHTRPQRGSRALFRAVVLSEIQPENTATELPIVSNLPSITFLADRDDLGIPEDLKLYIRVFVITDFIKFLHGIGYLDIFNYSFSIEEFLENWKSSRSN